ncbi:hypothetical protein T4A_5586 [Trichinella pseudospiralis]|uniref:Uncharacterized protein n=1 Tax=Trichinella pseudospiralis TaxID=6337 RepID=A0A0V1ESW4_TRIPS|nr:hypothetical protein T4A_5586 [Trichinella pseudospiralis]KRZ45296.1 hypothetical protein T4C_5261 [Trichinella pseudospiralis]
MEAFRVPRTRNEQDDVFPTHFLIGQDWYSESDVEDTMNLSSVKEHLNGHNSQLSCALIVQKSKMVQSRRSRNSGSSTPWDNNSRMCKTQ